MRKLSIKILVVVGLIIAGLFVWRQLNGQEKLRDKIQLQQALTSVHVRVFSQENLLLTPVNAQDKAAWGEVLDEIRKFVVADDPSLIKDFVAITDINMRLLTTLNEMYQQISAGQDGLKGKKVNVAKINFIELITKMEKNLSAPQAQLGVIQQNLDKTLKTYRKSISSRMKSMFGRKEKGDSCELLITFALSIDTALQKVANDIGTLLGKKITEVAATVFSAENIIFTDISPRDKRTWERLLEEVSAFVTYQNKEALGDYTVLANASSQVITALQHLYAKLKKGLPLDPDKMERIKNFNAGKVNVTDITSSLREDLASSMHQVSQMRQSLEQKVAKFTKDTPDSIKAATRLLVIFATTLDTTIQQIVNEVATLFPKFEFAVRRM